MTKRKKRIIRWVVFLLLAYFVTRPMYYPGVGKLPEPHNVSQAQIITPEEIDNFLISWSELLEKDFNNKEMLALLKNTDNPNKVISKRAKRWISLQGWEVKRFFFVGRRVIAILNECHKQKYLKEKRNSLEKQMANTKDESIIGTIRRIIDDDAQLSENITENEINIIMPHIDIIDDILQGKVAYQPKH